MTKRQLLKRYGLTLLGIAAGALGGYLYWLYAGCPDGSCPITASPVNTSLWGAAIGGLLLNTFQREKKDDA